MKKILLALAMFAMFASSAFAQNVNFGANISYQSAAMVGDHTDWFADDNASSGYAVGLNVRVPFSQLLSLRTGLDFQVNVYNYTEKVVTKEYDQSNLFLALQLPLLARINFTRGFFMEAGLDMGFNLLAKHYNEALDKVDDEDAWSDIKDWSVFTLGPSVGLGYTMWFGLEFRGRFSYSLLSDYDKNEMKLNPLRFQIDIAYWFGYKN